MRRSSEVSGSCIVVMAFGAHLALGQTPASAAETPDAAGTPPAAPKLNTSSNGVDGAQPKSKGETETRAYSRYRANSLIGFTGLMHTASADSGAPGTFRLSFVASNYSGSGFLCPSVDACGARPAGVTDSQDKVRRNTQDIAISATLTPYLEATVALHSQAVSDNFGTSSVMQTIGDSYYGIKAFSPRHADQVFSVGGLGQLRVLGGSGGIGADAVNYTLGALGTLDLTNRQDPAKRMPLRFHSNVGYLFDNSSSIAENTERSRQRPITRIERYGLNINRLDSVLLGLGGEYIGALIQPFAEWTIDITANRQGYRCHLAQVAPGDLCLTNAGAMAGAPSRLTFGTRLTPPVPGLSATLALDVGTSATSTFVQERAPETPWNLYLGIAYAIDTFVVPEPKVVVATPAPVPIARPPQYHLIGKVVDEASSEPIAHALVQFESPDMTGMIAQSDGSFESANVAPGEYKLTVSAEGYNSSTCVVAIESKPEPKPESKKPATDDPVIRNAAVRCALKAAPPVGTLSGSVVDAQSGVPIANARINVRDARNRAIELQSDAAGTFSVANIPTGEAHLGTVADGYLPSTVDLTMKKDGELHLTLTIRKLPKKLNVTIAPKELKLTGQVRFTGRSHELEADSRLLLQEVAAALVQHPELATLEIQSYVDDSGDAASDQRLSEQRAQAVRMQLNALGVDASRLTVAARGSETPLVPNVSESNRAKNRRIKFAIQMRTKP